MQQKQDGEGQANIIELM